MLGTVERENKGTMKGSVRWNEKRGKVLFGG